MTGLPAHAIGTEMYPRLLPLGDAALIVEFGDVIEPELNDRVIALDLALIAINLPGIVETVPTYRSLLIYYEPDELDFASLVFSLRDLLGKEWTQPLNSGRRWAIPVAYGTPFGDDLIEIGGRCGLSSDEVIGAHTSVDFLVYMVGFAPGIPNLGGLPECLRIHRRAIPRPTIPAGSVVIAGAQASIVSVAMPSGWHVLGRTPVRPYQRDSETPFLFRAGDRVRFYAIGSESYTRLEACVSRGEIIVEPETL